MTQTTDIDFLWEVLKVVIFPMAVGAFWFLYRRQVEMHDENREMFRDHEELDTRRFDEMDEALKQQLVDANASREKLHDKIVDVKDELSKEIQSSRHRISNTMQVELQKIDDRIDGVMKLLLEQKPNR